MFEVFNVGDRVYKKGYADFYELGTVIKVSPKRYDVTVDFGTYKDIFNRHGWLKGQSVYGTVRINHLTFEAEKMIKKQQTIRECKKLFQTADLTEDQAERIIQILKEGEGWEAEGVDEL